MLEKALALGMTEGEYNTLRDRLDREPTSTELAMVSVEWSEHCGYPRSKNLLRLLPKDGHYASVSGADTGGIEIEPGLTVVFKMESHNHPSQVEPRQGAATGIGGIVRDIFTVGARPIANLNSLRFGLLDDPQHGALARYLFAGVVDGISFYGNCLAPEETITVRRGARVQTLPIGEWCESVIKDGTNAADPVAEVLSFDPTSNQATWNEVEAVFRRRAAELVTVSSALGRKWRVTPDHPMLVWNNGEWQVKAAGELEKGDRLALLTDTTEKQSREKQFDLLELLGGRRADVRVLHPVAAHEKTIVQSVLRRRVSSAQKRFAMLHGERFPVAVWRELEKLLGWKREDARLVVRGGKSHPVPVVVNADADFARLVGYYLAEGCLSVNGTTSKIIWTFGRDENEYVDDVCAILDRLGWRYSRRVESSTQSVWMSSWFIATLWQELQLGANAKTKKIPFGFVTQSPVLRRELLKGLLRGDGSVCLKTGKGSPLKIAFATTSRALFEGILLLLGEEGLVPCVHTRAAGSSLIQGRTHQIAPIFVLEFSSIEAVSHFREWFDAARNFKIEEGLSRYRDLSQSYPRHRKHDGFATIAVTQIERERGEFSVYDLQVANSHLFVTSGGLITHNCMGIPTVAGEVGFNPSYRGNCLVGAMSVGVVPSDQIASSAGRGVGNTVMYFGNATGRDGIGGCSILASHDLTDLEQRPSVQVGDPFAEKCLLEATLEALKTGAVVSMKDMGAAGLTCTTCEQAFDGIEQTGENVGMDIDLDRVPLREADMEAFEIMMSESQERMLGVIERGREQEIIDIFHKWNTHAVPLGTITDDGNITIRRGGEVVAQIGVKTLVEAPRYELPQEEPEYLSQKHNFDFGQIPVASDFKNAFLRLLESPNIASKEWVYRQYDHMVQINTLVRPGEGDAAVLRLRESKTGKGLAMKADCNSRYVYLDPFVGSQIAIAECARNIVCSGGEPAGVTDCLCFGNPEKPDRFWGFARSIEGIAEACKHFRLPVVSGNVSLYNETPESAIHPSPLIGMVGVVENAERAMTMAFRDEGDVVVLVGHCRDELGGSEHLFVEHGLEEGRPPQLDLHLELNVQRLTLAAIRRGLVKSAHDCADGGLAVAIAECCIAGEIGAQIELPEGVEEVRETRLDAVLFGESQSRVVFSLQRENLAELQRMAGIAKVPLCVLGSVGGDELSVGDLRSGALEHVLDASLAEMTHAYRGSIGRLMSK